LLALLSGQATAAPPQVSAGAYHLVANRLDGTLCGEMVSDPNCLEKWCPTPIATPIAAIAASPIVALFSPHTVMDMVDAAE
jgi:hypothetical protein